ncbi:MAG: Lrp/AsnC ligand binding domain-containing protein [Pseudolabrys sp.]|nr:Lrp/AsnC ligand binding domain-containing protein [Pseudolabrys sp.]
MISVDTSADKIDKRLLAELQQDGRVSIVDLADRVGLSPTATTERVRRLTRDGYILGYSARLNPEKLERGLLVFIEVKLDRTTPDIFDRFAQAVVRAPEVLECHMVAGGFDYLVKIRVADMTAYRQFLGGVLLSLPGVRETHTYAVMEEIKNTAALPL